MKVGTNLFPLGYNKRVTLNQKIKPLFVSPQNRFGLS
jgi:hypothetical protein